MFSKYRKVFADLSKECEVCKMGLISNIVGSKIIYDLRNFIIIMKMKEIHKLANKKKLS